MSSFHQNLEDFYTSYNHSCPIKLYYERRSRQYANYHEQILRSNVVTLHSQIRTFTAMFLNEPHSTHRYPGELLKAYKTKLFKDGQSYYPYYVSSLAFYTLEKMINYGILDQKYKRYRYHLLFLIRKNAIQDNLSLEKNEIEKKCKELIALICDDTKFKYLIDICTNSLDRAISRNKGSFIAVTRLASFTNELDKNYS